MRRLYRAIYLAVIASLLSVVLITGVALHFGAPMGPLGQGVEFASGFVDAALPAPDRPLVEQAAAVTRIASRLHTSVSLFDGNGRSIAATGAELSPPPRDAKSGSFHEGDGGPAWSLRLTDGRWVVIGAPSRHRNPILALVLSLAAIAGIVAICAYPVVRGLTGRIERLQRGVETLAAGDLGSRVRVEGKDEVAQLAESFNRAAARIEELVGTHRLLLANASHELRTPLSRIRLGVELLQQSNDPKYRASMETDLRELEDLIESLLLASRLDATQEITSSEAVDLLALAAEESVHFADCSVEGQPVVIAGDAKLLRHLVRNLLENASRHGAPPVIVRVEPLEKNVQLDVMDHGPGIQAADRDRIFEPFYRARRDTAGTGLGLALVRRIARLHGGDAMVIERTDGQTCMRVQLALSARSAAQA
jgi:signal transduction histidine kinase